DGAGDQAVRVVARSPPVQRSQARPPWRPSSGSVEAADAPGLVARTEAMLAGRVHELRPPEGEEVEQRRGAREGRIGVSGERRIDEPGAAAVVEQAPRAIA